MGALGWLSTLGGFGAAALLWFVLGWPYSLGYLLFVFLGLGFGPLIRSQGFYRIALAQVQQNFEANDDSDVRDFLTHLRESIEEARKQQLFPS